MGVHIVVVQVDDAAGDVGAVVAGAFQAGQQVGPDKAGLNAAVALLEPQNVAGAHLLFQNVDDLFQRLHLVGCFQGVIQESGEGQVDGLVGGGHQHSQLTLGGVGEFQAFFAELLGGFHQIHAVIGDPLEVADGFQQHGSLGIVGLADLLGAELDQVGTQNVLVVVGLVFMLLDSGGQFRRVAIQAGNAVPEGLGGAVGHLGRQALAALQGDGGGVQQTLVQLGHGFGMLAVGNQLAYQLLKQAGHRQQEDGAEDIEDGVGNCNAEFGGGHVQQCGGKQGLDDAENSQPYHCADDIKAQVHQSGPTGVFGGANGGEDGGDAGADVLAHDDGDGGAVGDLAGAGQRLQDTDGGRTGLNDGGQNRAGQAAQDGILEGDKQLLECGNILKAGDGAGHGFHAEHQRGKTQQDQTGVFLLAVLEEHVVDDANQRQDRGKGGGLQQLDEDVAAFDAAEAEDPGGDGGADVSAHDDVDGLTQGQQAGVDEADHHDGGGGGTLNDGGDGKTGQEAHGLVGGQLTEQNPETVTGPALQGLAHEVHAKQKQT